MIDLLLTTLTQVLTFIPLALGISISYYMLRATDMTLDGSFVLGAALFARLVTLNISPQFAFIVAMLGGAAAGLLTANIQRGGRIDPLLAGIIATFILATLNLIIMNRPNINLLTENTLFSAAFSKGDLAGWILVASYVTAISILLMLIMQSSIGLRLRGLGDNALLLPKIGLNIETYRCLGFAITNMLAAISGCFTAQTIGYADINMGFGMTLTGIGAIILGQQIVKRLVKKNFRVFLEFIACLVGVVLYFFALNSLLYLGINPLYLKMSLGVILILFLRTSLPISSVRT